MTTKVDGDGRLFLTEQTVAGTDIPGNGQLWVKDDVPNRPMFTDDGGTDLELAGQIGKNYIINGTFDIWQRATSQTSSGYGSDDRWGNLITGTTQVASQQTFTLGQTDVPNNPTYHARTVVTSVAGAGNFALKYQPIEGVETLSGKTAVVDFYAKADASKNIALEFIQSFGTGGSPSAQVTGIGSQLVALTSAWQHFQIEVAVPSITGKTLGSNGDDYLGLIFWLDAGSDWNARASSLGQQSGTFDFSEIKVYEKGKQCEPRRSEGQELELCRRYYIDTRYGAVGTAWAFQISTTYVAAGNNYHTCETLMTTMRATPTMTYVNGTNFLFGTTGAFQGVSRNGFNFYSTASGTGNGGYLIGNYTASAEL